MHGRRAQGRLPIDYRGAGTVEFLYDPGSERFFLPRDEHPAPGRAPGHRAGSRRRPGRDAAAVAEGASLDGWAVAGEPMGHAIEVRLYAEDPRRTTSRRAAG